ncbi:MAG: MFS transporter [Desulfobacteraceae bacterium]|nr:MFS transporter [Desulfobacteraceae bacterium]
MNKFVISSQYFLYFGVMGIFLPYFNLYCYHIGFSGYQIGLLSALRSVVMVLFSLIWGILADRFLVRRPIYILCNFVSMAIWSLFLYTVDYYMMIVVTICYTIFYAPLISFLEAFTMDVLGKEKKSYGRVRVWGSLSFITVVTLLGKIIGIYSIKIIIALILAGSLIQAVVALNIPSIANTPFSIRGETNSFITGTKAFCRKQVVIFLVCAFLMLVSHGAYYGFFSIHLENMGYGSTFIGFAWALASSSEIMVMINSDRIFRRFSIENVLFFSFMIAGLRWLTLFFAHSPAVILISQLLHAVTYGTFHIASILYIDLLAPGEAKTMGQVVNNAVTYGLGMMTGFFINGYLFEITASSNLFIMSAFIAFAGGFLLKVKG